MSDTSGRVNFGELAKQVRINVRGYRPDQEERKKKPGAATPSKQKKKATPITVEPPNATNIFWLPLNVEGLLIKAYIHSEMLEYLKRMAEFIETAASDELDVVTKEYDVESNDSFAALLSSIREKAEAGTSTEFNGAAKRSFIVCSNRWATELLGRSDPTRIKLKEIVEAVQKSPDHALRLAPDHILLEYGRRLILSAMPSGKTDEQTVKSVIDSYYNQHQEFMREHPDASEWGSKTIEKTLKSYSKLLVGAV